MIGAGAGDALRVARFLHGRSQFRARAGDIFISSYPRSGTTWLQHIAHALRSGGDLDFAHISEVVPWFERSLSLGRRSAGDFAALPGPRIFKSHLPRAWLPRGARYLYVQRDGRDVLVSYYHFYRSHLGLDESFERFFERFMRGELQYGSWFKHVAGWNRCAGDHSVLIVRYERLLEDLEREIDRIASFLELAPDARTRERLRAICDFAFMKLHEAKFDHSTAEPAGAADAVAPGRFIRRGTRGAFAELFSAEHHRRFEARLAAPPRWPGLELDLPAFLC